MKVLVTGAGGFLGQRMAKELVRIDRVNTLVLSDVSAPNVEELESLSSDRHVKIVTEQADLTTEEDIDKIITPDLAVVMLFHGIMSGGAEKDFDLGMKVNFEATRMVLDKIRHKCPRARVIYTSSTAVYGGENKPDVITEAFKTNPQSSYGMEKTLCEYLVNDYSRRGFCDGIVLRYPTVIVRPGPPSSATSSFCSGIIREPLNGEPAQLPVRRDLRMWFGGVSNVVKNTIHAATVPAVQLGSSRTINLPGCSVTVQEMLDALVEVAGQEKLQYIKDVKDPVVEHIVTSWPSNFDTTRAYKLGFYHDPGFKQAIKDFITEQQQHHPN